MNRPTLADPATAMRQSELAISFARAALRAADVAEADGYFGAAEPGSP